MRGLFWNIYRKNLFEPLVDLVSQRKIDIVVLAEADNLNLNELCNELSKAGVDFKESKSIKATSRIKTIYKQNIYEQEILQEHKYWSISKYYNNIVEYILVGIHLPVINMNEADKAHISRRLLRDILEVENRVGHDRTILVGDFNSNPFDDELLNIDGICGIPIKDFALLNSRTYKQEQYNFFYNPSWRLLSQNSPPYGTYFKYPEHLRTIYWHVLDQVIIRPSLISEFSHKDFSIVSETNKYSFLKNNKPDKDSFSDHIPIVFTLK